MNMLVKLSPKNGIRSLYNGRKSEEIKDKFQKKFEICG
jgi:hypothetical protein